MSNQTKKHSIYIASPLFCDEDNAVLDRVESTLDRLGISYFSPRKHSNVGGDIRNAKTPEEKDAIAQRIFDLNSDAIHQAEIILVNNAGTRYNNAIYGDQGTLIEAGIAFEANIPVVTFNFLKYGLNIMMSQKSVHHFDDLDLDNHESLDLIKNIVDRYKQVIDDNRLHNKDYGWSTISDEGKVICKQMRSEFWNMTNRELV